MQAHTYELTQAQTNFLQCNEREARFLAGIGSGKTFIASLFALIKALEGHTVLYVLPTFSNIGDIAFPMLREHIANIGLKDADYALVKSPPTLTVKGGGSILLRSAEQEERLRGINCSVLIIDECATISADVQRILLGRCREGDRQWIRYIGTPRGGSHWYSTIDCVTFKQSTLTNPHISDEYKHSLVASYRAFGEDFMRQELFGDPTDSESGDYLISAMLVSSARKAMEIVDETEAIICGLDVGRSLDRDPSVLVARQGKRIIMVREYKERDTTVLAQRVLTDIKQLPKEPNALVVDAVGVGGPVVDILRATNGGLTVIREFMGHLPASDHKIANKRAESYIRCRDWLKDGGKLTNLTHWEQLSWVCWQLNGSGKLLLEPKEQVKSRNGRSPDYADALTMTFDSTTTVDARQFNPYAIQGEF